MTIRATYFSSHHSPIRTEYHYSPDFLLMDGDLAIHGMSEPAKKQVRRMAAACRSISGYSSIHDANLNSDAVATLQQLRDIYDAHAEGKPLKMLFWCLADAMCATGKEDEAAAWEDVQDALTTLIKDLGFD